MDKLLRGIAEFRRTRRAGYAGTFARLALGQAPDALLIACSDSRVVPNLFASAEPGDLFVVRNVGNLVPPHALTPDGAAGESVKAAIEFAVLSLRVRDIIVCGHSECGAIRLLGNDLPPADAVALKAWIRHARPALLGPPLAADNRPPHDLVSQANVLRQIENLRTYPSVERAVAQGRLALHAWWFDIARAEVLDWDPEERRFVPLDEERVEALLEARRRVSGAPGASGA